MLHLKFDKDRLVSCSKDRTVIVWKRQDNGQYVKDNVLEGHKAAINVVEFDDQYIVSASGDRTIR